MLRDELLTGLGVPHYFHTRSAATVDVDVDPEQRRRLVEEIFGAEFARDYKKGEEIVAARAMYVSQQPPPSHRCRRRS